MKLPIAFLPLLFAAALSAGEDRNITVNPPKGAPRSINSRPSDRYDPSRVEAKLNINIKDETERVHFIRDNSDPYVITKAYLVRNADVFTLHGVLKTIVSGSIVDDPVEIDTVKYNDGAGVLLISAEEYRFKNAGNGMSMDELVSTLDRKGLVNSYGTVDMAYYPRYNPAAVLLAMMQHSGIGYTQAAQNDRTAEFAAMGLSTPSDLYSSALTDDRMNVLVMSTAGFDVAEALAFLREVDRPAREIRFHYKLLEVYAENDQKIGADFQAWKNNDGLDLFSAGGRYGTNWGADGLTPNRGFVYTDYYNFNPKWNTKYLDFLTVCGKAKVVSSGTLTVTHLAEVNLTMADGLFSVVAKEIRGKNAASPKTTVTTTSTDETTHTTVTTTEEYEPENRVIPWTLEDLLPSVEGQGSYAERAAAIPEQVLLQPVRQGRTQETEAAYGNLFQLSIYGDLHAKASNLSIALGSTSLIGWDGQGKARMTRSTYTTQIHMNNDNVEFVIGGITKNTVVRSVTGVPFLKDLPVVGWLFSTETDTVKSSQFVLVAQAELQSPADDLDPDVRSSLNAVEGKVHKAQEHPLTEPLNFQQYMLDRQSLKPGEVK